MAKSGPAPLNDTNKLLTALSYPIWIIALIMILIDTSKKDKFVRYHAWQALWFNIIWYAGWFVLAIITFFLGGLLGWLFSVFMLVVSIIYAVKVYGGAYVEVPVIYNWFKKFIEK